MRHLSFGAIALACVIAAPGLARAADEPSRQQADAEAASGYDAMPEAWGYHPLGYAQDSRMMHPVVVVPIRRAAPVIMMPHTADEVFLEQGDRGLGND
ncbi:hypothetical protein ACI7BZ_18045 [Xanthobacter sp. AM11]|uniref:hypothetical protein n=1 Tax=Xanthobacter sp. AM11 TaxID=3380643 RepID=UPI0039BF1485